MAKIFISHSSEDKDIVDVFKNIILNAGLGVSDSDIAYTSAPETGVPTGGNIPQYIKENLADSDFVFFMISDNYRKSEVCLNEMGAAWALDKKVKPLLLYDVSFKSIGWLYGMNLCSKITDSDRLDELRDDFLATYSSCPKTAVWNKKKAEFLAKMEILKQNNTERICIDTPIEDSEEFGLLDYRETFDSHMASFTQITEILTEELNQLAYKTTTRTKQLTSLNPQSPNMSQMRGIMIGFANDMNRMSDAIDDNATKLLNHFEVAMKNAISIQQCIEANQDAKKEDRDALNVLIHTMISAKDSIIQYKDSLSSIPKMEKNLNVAKNRLSKGLSSLIVVYDGCIIKATDLLKA